MFNNISSSQGEEELILILKNMMKMMMTFSMIQVSLIQLRNLKKQSLNRLNKFFLNLKHQLLKLEAIP
ncbi:conserved hypothetical protein [Ricinus communis]|uniref:Uncharacterized protein n=1 Tax=Ricinus communis TaxID=3988 RepID=B9SHS0_RICCO|nr:conserved hypothetical protein [Ricinus communis]